MFVVNSIIIISIYTIDINKSNHFITKKILVSSTKNPNNLSNYSQSLYKITLKLLITFELLYRNDVNA